jgi:hypothetical protein
VLSLFLVDVVGAARRMRCGTTKWRSTAERVVRRRPTEIPPQRTGLDCANGRLEPSRKDRARTIWPNGQLPLVPESLIESPGWRTLTIARSEGVARMEKNILRWQIKPPTMARDYRPLVELTRKQKVDVIAGNLPRTVAGKVASKEGSLSPFLRRATTAPLDRYWELFGEAMKGHPGAGRSSGCTGRNAPRMMQWSRVLPTTCSCQARSLAA